MAMNEAPHGVREMRSSASLKRLIALMFVPLIAANIAVWIWALAAFHDHPVLLGTCALAYVLGLRHAAQADHIAAIDNVTRKLLQE
jgi:high-affinity nickel-transport protein